MEYPKAEDIKEATKDETGRPMTAFDVLNALNVNGHIDEKIVDRVKLSYLSWPWAWAEVKKRFPDAHYEIWRSEQNLPYAYDPATGYMVYTSVTIDGITHEMWLPVMNNANKAMRSQPYKYATKFGEKTVEAATMMDINKAIMRCLVKNLAMFGLGLYIYAGEDLPEAESGPEPVPTAPVNKASGPENGNVQHTDKLPLEQRVQQAINGAPAAPPPEPPKPETPAAFISRSLKEITAKNAGFDFMKTRAELIKGGVIEDIPSATMNMEQAKSLIQAIEKNLREAS